MAAINIYDEEKMARLLYVQKAQGIDFNLDLDWKRSIDLNKLLLPLGDNTSLFPQLSQEQRLVVSQMIGLVVAATISELEDVAYKLKGPTWENVLRKYPINPEIYEMGELFYEDEKKHSEGFKRYIDLFAEKVNVDPLELRQLLPSSQNSLSEKIYHLNSLAGGMAIWWLIAAVEEESILIFNYMRKCKSEIDPLYYDLHKAHYEEEIRHKSYASIMLQVNSEFAGVPQQLIFKNIDFILAEILNLTWTFNQLYKLKNLSLLKSAHPFFKTLADLRPFLEGRNSMEIIHSFFTSAPYIKDMFQLSEHGHVRQMLERFGTKRIPLSFFKQRVS